MYVTSAVTLSPDNIRDRLVPLSGGQAIPEQDAGHIRQRERLWPIFGPLSQPFSNMYLFSKIGCRYVQIQESADVTSEIDATLKRLSSQQIQIPHPAQVRDYLLRYSDILDVLPSICQAVLDRFDADTCLSAEVYSDEYLTIYVRQTCYDENIMDIINSISEEYEEELSIGEGWLLVTTDFQPPR